MPTICARVKRATTLFMPIALVVKLDAAADRDQRCLSAMGRIAVDAGLRIAALTGVTYHPVKRGSSVSATLNLYDDQLTAAVVYGDQDNRSVGAVVIGLIAMGLASLEDGAQS